MIKAAAAYVPDACDRPGNRDRAGISVGADIKGGYDMWRMRYVLKKLKEEDGVGVVEVILILVVLIGLVIIFKSQLTSLVQNIFSKIVSESAGI